MSVKIYSVLKFDCQTMSEYRNVRALCCHKSFFLLNRKWEDGEKGLKS